MLRLAIDDYYRKKIIQRFEELFSIYPGIIREMAEQGDILDPALLKVCKRHGLSCLAEESK